MKNFLLLSSFLLFSMAAQAEHIDESKVPVTVRDYVKTNYSQATTVKWEFEKKKNYYEAEFEINGLEHELNISPAGALLYADIDILPETLPSAVHTYLKSSYPNAKITEADKIMDNGLVKYKVEVAGENSKGDKKNKNLYFDASGNPIKKK